MMKKIFLVFSITILILGGGFLYLYNKPQLPILQKTPSHVEIKADTPETYCQKNGGNIQTIDTSSGMVRICRFSDGTFCEEQEFYNNPGISCHNIDNIIDRATEYCEKQGYVVSAHQTETGWIHTCRVPFNECEVWAFMNGECKAGKDPLGLENSTDPMYVFIKDSRKYEDNCMVKIGDIEQLKNDISMKTGGIIETISIKDSCGKSREFSSKLADYKETYKDLKYKSTLENLIQENDKYIIYSLVDTNRDIYYIEYPVIVYNKQKQTNTLFTIRLNIPRFEYLDNEGNIIINSLNEEGSTRYVFNIPENKIVGEYSSPRLDCGDESLARDREKNAIILHNFDKGSCGYDYEGRDLETEKTLAGILTYKDSTKPLGTFNKGSKLHATNEDILESVKGNTFIFHVDNTRYELSNNKLIKK